MEILFSSYRLDQYTNPDAFCPQVGMIFESFPEDVVMRATDPLTGIQAHHRWPPVPAEIREFLERTNRVVAGERILAERAALGFHWVDDPAENRVGFYNQQGLRWEDRQKQLAPRRPLSIVDKGRLDRVLARAVQRLDKPKLVLTPDDGKHVERIKDDLERRRAVNIQRAEKEAERSEIAVQRDAAE